MMIEPAEKRAITFIDGQNLYHCAREAFGISHPNYDVRKLSEMVCQAGGWSLRQVRFYTGYPSQRDDPFWGYFWQRKLLAISRQNVFKFARPLRYRTRQITSEAGDDVSVRVAEEKGIDVRIAIDLIRMALDDEYDVAIIFSQDQDLSEATDEIKKIARTTGRWIKVVCAYPIGPGTLNARGINGTDWFKISEDQYSACVDDTDYRMKR
jgi:uncharacterized LabA/DUF88 family protein